MNDTARRHRDRADRLADVIDHGTDFDAASPCNGWTARDVVDHLVSTQADLLDQHGFGVPGVDVADDPAAAWRTHTDNVVATLDRPEVVDHRYDGMAGTTTIGDTISTFFGFDLLVHRWDLGTALGVPVTFTDDELDAIESCAAAFGDGIRMEGVCGPAVAVDPSAPRQVRVLAHLGRDART